jgi:hypothetical protein
MAAVLAGAGVGERLAGHRAKGERVVTFTACEQTGVRSGRRTAEWRRRSAAEIEPERLAIRFTRRVRRDIGSRIGLICCYHS